MSYANRAGSTTQQQPPPATNQRSSTSKKGSQDTREGTFQEQLQQVRSRDGRTEREILQDTCRTLAQTDECATRTLGELHNQTEQLDKIAGDVHAIEGNLEQSEHLLKRMQPGQWVRNLFRKEPTVVATTANSKREKRVSQSNTFDPPRRGSQPGQRQAGGNLRPGEKAQDETDKLYDDVERLIGGLKDKGKEINRTLASHNERLPGISDNISRQQGKITKQQDMMKKV